MVYVIIKKGRSTRSDDLAYLEKQRHSSDKNIANNANKAYWSIKREDVKVESMRESLVKAHREGNTEEIKDIHEYVTSHSQYKRK